ncbi:hypothetical protein MRX96_043162 [Rhipicephalus microplus]
MVQALANTPLPPQRTTYRLNDDSPPHTEGLPSPAASPQGVEHSTCPLQENGPPNLPTTPPSDASAAMEVVEGEFLTRTATGGNTRKEAPLYGERLSPHIVSGGHTYQPQKEGEEEANQEAIAGYRIRRAQLPTFPQPFSKAPTVWTPQRSTAVQQGSPPDTEGFQVVTTKREVPDAVPGTLLLLRPSRSTLPLWAQFPCSGRQPPEVPSVDLHASSSHRRSLQGPAWPRIRVNQKRNIVAADATTRECLEQLLTIKELKGIPVTAKEPADHKTSTGFLHGVDGEPAVDSLLPGIQSAVPVLSATKEGANRDAPLRRPSAAGARVTLLGPFPSVASQTPPSAAPAMRSVRPCEGELQLARQLHQM